MLKTDEVNLDGETKRALYIPHELHDALKTHILFAASSGLRVSDEVVAAAMMSALETVKLDDPETREQVRQHLLDKGILLLEKPDDSKV